MTDANRYWTDPEYRAAVKRKSTERFVTRYEGDIASREDLSPDLSLTPEKIRLSMKGDKK